MTPLQAVHGRIVDLRRHPNVHLYGRRPLGPTDRYELWIKPRDGVERKFTVNTRVMPARRGHDVSVIVTAHKVPQVLALANWSTIDGVNYARTDAPSLFRVWDFILLPLTFLGLSASLGDVGMVLFVPGAAVHLAAAGVMRAVAQSRRAFAVDRAMTWRHGESIGSAWHSIEPPLLGRNGCEWVCECAKARGLPRSPWLR